jgi:hypothetical protein
MSPSLVCSVVIFQHLVKDLMKCYLMSKIHSFQWRYKICFIILHIYTFLRGNLILAPFASSAGDMIKENLSQNTSVCFHSLPRFYCSIFRLLYMYNLYYQIIQKIILSVIAKARVQYFVFLNKCNICSLKSWFQL